MYGSVNSSVSDPELDPFHFGNPETDPGSNNSAKIIGKISTKIKINIHIFLFQNIGFFFNWNNKYLPHK